MTRADQFFRSCFVALAVGLGWGIRGDFGHLVGAMYPGACLALGLAYVSRQRSLFLAMPVLAAVSAIGIGSGGSMSYGILHGYAQSDTFINYSYGFLTLFLQGAAWGTFGGAMIGLLLECRPMKTGEWLGYVAAILAGGWFTSLIVVTWLGFNINPPRNNTSIAFFGAALGQLLWLAANRRWTGLRGGLLGYFGFGLGMAGGRLLGNFSAVLQESSLQFSINHWNVMEVSCGLIGGFIFCYGMVRHLYPSPAGGENSSWLATISMIFVLGVIPLWHGLDRVHEQGRLEEWVKQFASYGYAEPRQMAELTLGLVDLVCVLGFVGAGIWMLIHFCRWERLAWFPVLWLSLTMLLFQNLTAHYFFYPAAARRINMHSVFWVLFAGMATYVVVTSYLRPKPVLDLPAPEVDTPVPWIRWSAAALVTLAGIVFLAGFTNGDITMRSANTRWPVWSWSQGPFPGRELKSDTQ